MREVDLNEEIIAEFDPPEIPPRYVVEARFRNTEWEWVNPTAYLNPEDAIDMAQSLAANGRHTRVKKVSFSDYPKPEVERFPVIPAPVDETTLIKRYQESIEDRTVLEDLG